MAIEIVDLPSYKLVIFHSYVTNNQRVYLEYLMVSPSIPDFDPSTSSTMQTYLVIGILPTCH